jgi:ubiquinone biosynthesis protein
VESWPYPMLDPSSILAELGHFSPDQLNLAIENLLPKTASTAQKISTVETGLNSPLGKSLREVMARWIVDQVVPVDRLVPESYLRWRPPVRDSMLFVVTHLSPARLAPKLIEQLELPPATSPEVRLLRLIAKVPGLQKLGQVIARNQNLHPALRKELSRLENGIRDVSPCDIRVILESELGDKIRAFSVKISPNILKEASVSAVVRFNWIDPRNQKRQRGVFKVLKPYIPEYFAEDMEYLQALANHFGDRHHTYGLAPHLIPDTFRKVQRLLRHEVNFTREQKTLIEAAEQYRSFSGVRIPNVIQELCTPKVTALSEEQGIKVTNAAARLPEAARRRIAEQVIEALVAVPLFSSAESAIFHGDPHAGNLLYNNPKRELTLLDWALRERLDRELRRHLALLFLMVSLRDPVGVSREVIELSQERASISATQRRKVRQTVLEFLDQSQTGSSATNAMRLLEAIALQGVKFPASLIMLSKVMLTLEGVLGEMVGPDTGMTFAIARHVASHWISNRSQFRLPLKTRDWIALQCSALLYTSRVGIDWEQTAFDRLISTLSKAEARTSSSP